MCERLNVNSCKLVNKEHGQLRSSFESALNVAPTVAKRERDCASDRDSSFLHIKPTSAVTLFRVVSFRQITSSEARE